MNRDVQTDSEPSSDKKAVPPRKWLWISIWIAVSIAGLAVVVLGLIYTSYFVSYGTDPVQFVTANLLNALIFVAIVAQVLIYRKQWHVMEQSTQIAERALVAGERAFVSANFRQTALQSLQAGGGITHWNFTPTWTNYGNTPTRNCISHVCHKIFDGDVPDDWDFPDLWEDAPLGDRKYIPFSIAPKGARDGHGISVPVETLEDLINGEKSVLFWGWVEYNDVFPDTQKHITRFAAKIVAGGNPRNIERVSFYYLFVSRYNCSDEECNYQGYPAGRRNPA